MKKIVIIGGCAAGPKAAAKCKRINPDNEIELYTKENLISYSACGLPYFISGIVPNINKLIIRTKEDFEKNGINVFLNHECIKIDPKAKKVFFQNEKETSYDELILCTGSIPKKINVKNSHLKNIFNLKVIQDGIDIKKMTEISKSVVIIGGGYIALELTEAFVRNNLKITVLEKNSTIMPLLDTEISEKIKNYIVEKSHVEINYIFNDEVEEFIGEENFEGIKTKNGKIINADFCVIATGVVPNTDIAKEAGIETGTTGGIIVDNKMRTSIQNIYAAGDCTENIFIPTKQSVYLSLGTIANKQGRIAAINSSGEENDIKEYFDGILGSMVTKYFDYTVAATGLSEKRAYELKNYINITPITSTIEEYDKAGYMPQIGILTVKLIADKRTGEILGAQIVGTGDADKRIGTIAAAIRANLTVSEFLNLDLPYAPPFSSTIDPLLTATYKLKEMMDK